MDWNDEKGKQKAMKAVSSIPGIQSISMDTKDKKLTVIGDVDPVCIVSKLRKLGHTDIVSVGPAKDPKKEAEEKKKAEERKKEEEKRREEAKRLAELCKDYNPCYPNYPYPHPQYYCAKSYEENPNACVIQ